MGQEEAPKGLRNPSRGKLIAGLVAEGFKETFHAGKAKVHETVAKVMSDDDAAAKGRIERLKADISDERSSRMAGMIEKKLEVKEEILKQKLDKLKE